MEAFHPWEEGAGCHSTTVQEANDRGEAHTPLLTRYTTRSMIATVQEGLSESSPDNSARIVLASMRLGSFLANAFFKRWRASRDAVLLFLRAALGAYPGGNTRLSPKTGDCTGSTCMGISVTG
jgi:hypothetical protein